MARVPEIAVLIPVYRNQRGLEASLESLKQARGDFEVIVVDDGSPEPIRLPESTGIQVRLVRLEQNSGITVALNCGLELILQIGHQFVARLDAGDTVHPSRLIKQVKFLQSHPGHLLVSSWADFVDETGTNMFRYRVPADHDAVMSRMHLNNCLIHPAVMFRASVMHEVGLYDARASVSEDYEFFLRIAGHGKVAALQEVLTYCEYNYGGITVRRRREQQRERLRLQFEYFNPKCVMSYLGILRTLLSLATPHSWLVQYKRRAMSASRQGAAA